MGWSPEQIAGRLRREGSEHTVGGETIYRFIHPPRVLKDKLYRFLPRAKACPGAAQIQEPERAASGAALYSRTFAKPGFARRVRTAAAFLQNIRYCI